MNGLIQFLTTIQTFNLHIVTKAELKSPIKQDGDKPGHFGKNGQPFRI